MEMLTEEDFDSFSELERTQFVDRYQTILEKYKKCASSELAKVNTNMSFRVRSWLTRMVYPKSPADNRWVGIFNNQIIFFQRKKELLDPMSKEAQICDGFINLSKMTLGGIETLVAMNEYNTKFMLHQQFFDQTRGFEDIKSMYLINMEKYRLGRRFIGFIDDKLKEQRRIAELIKSSKHSVNIDLEKGKLKWTKSIITDLSAAYGIPAQTLINVIVVMAEKTGTKVNEISDNLKASMLADKFFAQQLETTKSVVGEYEQDLTELYNSF